MSYFNVVGNYSVFYTIISHEEFSMIQNPSGKLEKVNIKCFINKIHNYK
jgi:hypothetical protein